MNSSISYSTAAILIGVAIILTVVICKKRYEGFDGSGLNYYNQDVKCFKGNAMGSNDPYCASTGYVLF
jgi:hypothetical protein